VTAPESAPASSAEKRPLRVVLLLIAVAILVAVVAVVVASRQGGETSGPTSSSVPGTVPGSSSTTATTASTTPASTTMGATSTVVAGSTTTRAPTTVRSTSTTPVTTPGGPAGLGQVCTSARVALVIHYPTNWYATDDCVAFDPAPITVPQDSELPYVAVVVSRMEQDWATAKDLLLHQPQQFGTTEQLEETTLGGREAVCLVSIANGQGLAVVGARTFMCAVDFNGQAIVFSSLTPPGGADPAYDAAVRDVAAAATPA
jgi:hypothetical protein